MPGGLAGIAPGRISLRHLHRTALELLSKRPSYLRAIPLRRGKVRERSLAKVPILLVVGRREAEQRQVAVRRHGDSARPVLALGECVSALAGEAQPQDTTGRKDTPMN